MKILNIDPAQAALLGSLQEDVDAANAALSLAMRVALAGHGIVKLAGAIRLNVAAATLAIEDDNDKGESSS